MRFLKWIWSWPPLVKLAVLFAVLFVVFAVMNDDTVTIHLGLGRVETPMYVALTISGVLGLVPGLVAGHYYGRRRAKAKGGER
ncbi:MAG: LapA family protein [Planctomycetota bacterium]